MVVPSKALPAMLEGVRPHRFSLERYQAMIEQGILTQDDRVELIHGAVVDLSPIGNPHAAAVKRLNRLFMSIPAGMATVGIQDHVVLLPDSMPEPDVVLLHPREDFYAARAPEAQDVLLVVEVAQSSLRFDRLVKMPLYAESGISEAWIVNVPEDCIEVYTCPANGHYTQMKTLRRGETVTPIAFPDRSFAVQMILP
jgi:Uma2 family endonuclease